jgi:ABC-type lipoprotein release transport system permease subunit
MVFMMKLAWRNLFRNLRRSIIAGIAIGVGLAVLIFTDALMQGMKEEMVRSATGTYLGDGQIHRTGFRLRQQAELTINDADKIMAELASEPEVAAFAPRVESFGMITSPAGVSSVMVVGIDPPRERLLSEIEDHIVQGCFFAGSDAGDVVIGSGLADILQVSLGGRVVFTVSQAHGGELSQEMFRISGIYRFGQKDMDEGLAFIRIDRARNLLALRDGIHEIALKFKSFGFATQRDNPFWTRYSTGGNEAVSWAVLLPQLEGVMNMAWISLLFMAVVLFGVVAFGIINTLFMSLYERMFEFGIIRAVGTRRSGVRRLIIFEAGGLALLSIAVGTILGLLITFIVSRTGIDYRGIEFAGTTFSKLMYPVLQARQFIVYPAAVFLFTLLVALYPARVAGRLRIADALRLTL